MATAQPNIVIVMADFMSALALPMYGNTTIKAPHMRRLGEEGVVFENAYCNAPLCAPSRASLLTGLLPSKVGVYDNGSELPASIPTFAHYLRLTGYRTILSGKMHFVGPDQLHGFEERLTSDVVPSDFGWSPQPGGAPWEDDEFPDYPNLDEVVAAGPCIRSLGIDYDDEVTFTSVNKIYQMAREEADQPFLMTVSFIQPHPPFASPAEYWNRYDDGEIPMPSVAPIPVDEYDPVSRHLYEFSGMGRTDLSDDHVRRARHAYFAMLSHIDDRVGQILAALEATRFAPNTIVAVTADHGNMLGERGLWGLRTFFEWSERVPLVFHCPGAFAARRVHTPVSLVDLLPTLVDLAGGGGADSLPNPVDGRSLTGHLRGRSDTEERDVLAEYCGEGVPAPWLMIRRGRVTSSSTASNRHPCSSISTRIPTSASISRRIVPTPRPGTNCSRKSSSNGTRRACRRSSPKAFSAAPPSSKRTIAAGPRYGTMRSTTTPTVPGSAATGKRGRRPRSVRCFDSLGPVPGAGRPQMRTIMGSPEQDSETNRGL